MTGPYRIGEESPTRFTARRRKQRCSCREVLECACPLFLLPTSSEAQFSSTNGAHHTSLGQRPRLRCSYRFKG